MVGASRADSGGFARTRMSVSIALRRSGSDYRVELLSGSQGKLSNMLDSRTHRRLTLALALIVMVSNGLYLYLFGYQADHGEGVVGPAWLACNNLFLGLLMISMGFLREPQGLQRLRWFFLAVGAVNLGSALSIAVSLAR